MVLKWIAHILNPSNSPTDSEEEKQDSQAILETTLPHQLGKKDTELPKARMETAHPAL